jgi:hypothetical protein
VPRLTDPDRLAAYRDALRNWTFFVDWDSLPERAHRWIRRELGAIKHKEIGRLMYEYVEAGGEIDEVPEKDPDWATEHEFHYDLRFTIGDVRVYIETRLHFEPPFAEEKAWIEVVNIHDPKKSN